MHVLDDSPLTIVLQFILNSLLLHEALPVELALPHRIDLSRSIVDGAHHVVQVLVGNVGFPSLKLFRIVLGESTLQHLERLFLFDYL